MAYLAGYGGVQSFELLYVGLIDFGIGSFLFTGFLVVIGLNSVLSGTTPREAKVRNIWVFFSSRSLKMREKYISYAHLVLLSFYIF